jgi:hypothetical protein
VQEELGVNFNDTDNPMVRVLKTITPVLAAPETDKTMQALIDVLGRINAGQQLEPMTFYNFMVLAAKEMVIKAYPLFMDRPTLPSPDIKLVVKGWDAE